MVGVRVLSVPIAQIAVEAPVMSFIAKVKFVQTQHVLYPGIVNKSRQILLH